MSTPTTTTKVFVGNLSFKTKENELAAEFSSAGKVVSANIITRGPRSLGYGFVELENEEAALKSVQLLNKKTIDGREINVEIAKPRDETKIVEKKAQDATGEGARGRGGRGRGRGRGAHGPRRGSFRGRGYRGGRNAGEGDDARPAGGAAPATGGAAPPRPRRRPQKSAGPTTPKPSAPAAARTPSQTTLFVANLPFSVDDAGLTEIFKEFNVTKAHVVRKRNQRSKGFGFVEFSNEADQQKALSATDKKVVSERELIVKVALTESKAEGSAADAAAPAAAAPAAAAAAAPAAAQPAAEGEKKQ